MCSAESSKRGRTWTSFNQGPITFRLFNARVRERRNDYNEYAGSSSTSFAKIVNDNVGISATDVADTLGRLPAGFYAVVQHSGCEWRTENKPILVNNDNVDWDGLIPV